MNALICVDVLDQIQIYYTRIGAAVQTVKKVEAGSNKKAAPVVNAKKLDEVAEPTALDRVSTEVKQLMRIGAPVS